MLSEGLEAADAGFEVSYNSPSQFSREYGKIFGLPPAGDVSRLRQAGERRPCDADVAPVAVPCQRHALATLQREFPSLERSAAPGIFRNRLHIFCSASALSLQRISSRQATGTFSKAPSGEIRPLVTDVSPHRDAACAHEMLESGSCLGIVVLKPS